MKRHAFWIFLSVVVLALIIFSCSDPAEQLSAPCGTSATVRDLTGLDGCGFVFELGDGTLVTPTWDVSPYCGFGMTMDVAADPLYSFEFVEGKHVLIGFEERTDWATACMSARPVKITCLQELEAVAL